MKRRLLSLTLVLVLCLGLLSAPAAAAGFSRSKAYTPGQFTDVKDGDWFAASVKDAYELGLMGGNTASTFNPTGTFTLAEAATIAARMHHIYNGGDGVIPSSGGAWYQGAVDYCVSSGILPAGIADYLRPATRSEMAAVMAAALPAEAWGAINSVEVLPDVDAAAPNSGAIYQLYRAGVLTGSDSYGTFNPNATITRAEVAAIAARCADPSLRKTFTLTPDDRVSAAEVYSSANLALSGGSQTAAVLADLTHDGVPEKLVVSTYDSFLYALDIFTITPTGVRKIYTDYADSTNSSQRGFRLIQLGEQWYLMDYSLYLISGTGGLCGYSMDFFYLSQSGSPTYTYQDSFDGYLDDPGAGAFETLCNSYVAQSIPVVDTHYPLSLYSGQLDGLYAGVKIAPLPDLGVNVEDLLLLDQSMNYTVLGGNTSHPGLEIEMWYGAQDTFVITQRGYSVLGFQVGDEESAVRAALGGYPWCAVGQGDLNIHPYPGGKNGWEEDQYYLVFHFAGGKVSQIGFGMSPFGDYVGYDDWDF